MAKAEPTEKWKDEVALKRHEMIAPLLDDALDPSKRQQLRKLQAEKYDVSTRSLFRYEAAYRSGSFTALKPQSRERRPSPKLPDDFTNILQEAILLKREVPSRSVNQIIMILEMDGLVETGILSRSTLQRHLYNAGFGKKQMKKYTEAKATSSGRFAKPHRMMLLQADIKYAIKLPIGKNNNKPVQIYLSAAIDDHSRYVVSSGFYDNQEAVIVEDTFRKAILNYGKPDAIYVDNGSQYKSKELKKACAMLGIRLMHCRPYVAKSKGKVEVFNRFVDSFLAEAKAAKVKTLDELNRLWQIWLNAYYHDKPHSALGENISPKMAWNRDSRNLTFLDVNLIAQAFLHHEKRIVDKSGCISFKGRQYEVGLSLIGAQVAISYDPMKYETITVTYGEMEPIQAKPIEIGQFCAKEPEMPEHLLPKEPETSRFLAGLERKYEKQRVQLTNAISFGAYKKGVSTDV